MPFVFANVFVFKEKRLMRKNYHTKDKSSIAYNGYGYILVADKKEIKFY